MNFVSDSISNLNEESLLHKYGFVPSKYNGIPVWYNPKLNSHFYKVKNRKSKIVIHHTAGGLEGDLLTLLGANKVSVPFLISPKGKIIMLFHPWNWAWHLGKGALGGNETQSKLSIGIELSNWGFLVPRGEILYTHTGRPYCTKQDFALYSKINPWKLINPKTGEKVEYVANYSPEQYMSLLVLVDKLTSLYGIPKIRYEKGYSEDVINFKGICTHTDFRTDKYDLSPNFNWELLEL